MPQSFDFDPLALRPSKPLAFQPTVLEQLLDRMIMQELERGQRLRQGGPFLPLSPSLVEPLLPPGLFGTKGRPLQGKTGFAPFHADPNVTLRELFLMLLQGGQFRI